MLQNTLKMTIRNLKRHKVFTLINISGLATGLACCIIILLYVRSETGYDLYHKNKARIYRLTLEVVGLSSGNVWKSATSSIVWAPALQKDYPEIQATCRVHAARERTFRVGDFDYPEDNLLFADENALDFFTWPLRAGDPQTALVEPYSIVIDETTAQKYFGTENPIGRILITQDIRSQANDQARPDLQFKVTGVMQDIPYKSHLKPAMVLSFRTLNDFYNGDVTAGVAPDVWFWRGRVVHNYLQLRASASPELLEGKFPDFLDTYVGDATTTRGYEYRPYLQRLDTIHLEGEVNNTIERGGDKNQLYLFSVIAMFVLGIACINFMNLSTARSSARAREVGVRKVVGANRKNLIRQFLGESIFLTILALLFAIGLVRIINPIFYSYINRDFYMPTGDLPLIVLSALTIAVMVGVVSGSYPALFLSNFKPMAVLTAKLPSAGQGRNLRKALVVIQFAVTVFFIFATLTVYNQLNFMRTQELGVKTEQILVLPPDVSRPLLSQIEGYRNDLMRFPNIKRVTVSVAIPGREFGGDVWGEFGKPGEEGVSLSEFAVDYDFIDLFGLELLAGRQFSKEMATDAAPSEVEGPGYELAGIVNEAAVRRFGWESLQAALGKRIMRDPVSNDYTCNIIGVVRDFHFRSLQTEISPMILYINPHAARTFRFVSVEVRPERIAETISHIRETVAPALGEVPFEYFFVDERFAQLYQDEEVMVEIFGYISSLTIFIACLGLFGLASFAAEQRTKEVGIRKVLGASISSVITLLSLDFVKLVALSALIAFPVSFYVMSGWLEEFAYRFQIGTGTFLLSGLLALGIALLTVSSQALKAALLNPTKSLRHE